MVPVLQKLSTADTDPILKTLKREINLIKIRVDVLKVILLTVFVLVTS